MKVVIATPLYPPESGGPATYSKLLEEGLPPLGIEVVLVKFGDVRKRSFRHVRYFLSVLRAARDADIVYALDAVSVGYPAMWAARLRGKKFVVKIVGDYAWEQGKQRFDIKENLDVFVKLTNIPVKLQRYRRIQTQVASYAQKVVVPSRYLKDIVTTGWGIPETNVEIIHNAVRAEVEGSVPKEVAALPKLRVVSIGRLVPWKGFDDVIAAVSIVRKKNISASLVIVGDGPERKTLEQQAREQLQNDFVFTGQLPREQSYNVMLSSDVFVLDSSYEGLSHTLVEAFVGGIPVIVSDIPGNTEIVTNEQNGLLVAPGDPEALARALERTLTDDQLRRRLAAASEKSGRDFSVDAMLANVTALFDELAQV